MDHEIKSYRYAEEIIEHPNYCNALTEITTVINDCPLFIYPKKFPNRPKYDVVQQVMNSYFTKKFYDELNWEYHPYATQIPDSNLRADFKKTFKNNSREKEDLRIQAEVQFGNMSRWYSDIFKFQTAYSQGLIDMGLSIVPFSSVANRIDSNIVNFERCWRELPSANMSITLPILLIGLRVDERTPIVNIANTQFPSLGSITGKRKEANRFRIITGYLNGTPMEQINEHSSIEVDQNVPEPLDD